MDKIWYSKNKSGTFLWTTISCSCGSPTPLLRYKE